MNKKLGAIFWDVVFLTAFVVVLTGAGSVLAGGLEIERHESSGIINLNPGTERGTITLPLLKGTLSPGGQEVLFVITDASDKDFAAKYGTIRSDALADAPDAAVEFAIYDNGQWTFFQDGGLVSRFDTNGAVLPPLANPDYSPLKRFLWEGKLVTANVPFVKWGDGPGQQLIVDIGGCDPLIRTNPPSPFFIGGGPADGVDCSTGDPVDRYKGGQAVDIDLENMTVTMKLHKATFRHPDVIPYYTVFEASKAPPAGFMGVIHSPKLGNIGRFGENDAVGRIAQFSNGVRISDGGPNRFQNGITSYRGGTSRTYTPMWHITWVFFDCDNNGVFFIPDRNVGEGAQPQPGSEVPRFDPTHPAAFDPFQMYDKGVDCPGYAALVTGNSDGFIKDLGQLKDLIREGRVIQTEGPAGLRFGSDLQPPLIVNCPVPLTVR
ncbi:MAG: hypothetical protein ACE5E9_07990 [Nitrospinaceae bacterium]